MRLKAIQPSGSPVCKATNTTRFIEGERATSEVAAIDLNRHGPAAAGVNRLYLFGRLQATGDSDFEKA